MAAKGRCGRAKLSFADVRLIKAKLAAGTPRKEIAAEFNVHRTVVDRIARGRNWSYVR
jgi:hypothetical protein